MSWGGGGGHSCLAFYCVYCALERFSILLYPLIFPLPWCLQIGTEFIRGVSGGERKRTNIGMELIIEPQVLFWMNPPFFELNKHHNKIGCLHCKACISLQYSLCLGVLCVGCVLCLHLHACLHSTVRVCLCVFVSVYMCIGQLPAYLPVVSDGNSRLVFAG